METNSKENYDEVFNAKDKVAGRLASIVAKHLLEGKRIAVVNAEGAIISGKKQIVVGKYKIRVDLKNKVNPEHSPYWSRRPDLLLKRIIRGMLPFKKAKGKKAFHNLRVFIGVPEELKGAKLLEIESKNPRSIYAGYITIKELAESLGYRPRNL